MLQKTPGLNISADKKRLSTPFSVPREQSHHRPISSTLLPSFPPRLGAFCSKCNADTQNSYQPRQPPTALSNFPCSVVLQGTGVGLATMSGHNLQGGRSSVHIENRTRYLRGCLDDRHWFESPCWWIMGRLVGRRGWGWCACRLLRFGWVVEGEG